MKYYDIIISEKTNDKMDLYLMLKDERLERYIPGKSIDLESTPIKLVATNLVDQFRELDFPGVGIPEIISGEMKKLIEDLGCCDNIQFLPAYVENVKVTKKYFVLNFIQTEIDCFDVQNSEVAIFSDGSKHIIIPRIKADAKCKYNVFKIAESTWQLFVTDTFRKEFKKLKLSGCDFHLRTKESL